jgi:transposase
LRAILLERGIVAPQGKRKLEQFLTVLMDEQRGAGLSPRMITLIADARAQWAEFDQRIVSFRCCRYRRLTRSFALLRLIMFACPV